MADIHLTDQLGLTVNVTPDPNSAFSKYFAAIPALVTSGFDLKQIQGLNLDAPAVRSLDGGLNFGQPVSAVAGVAAVTIQAGLSGSFNVFVPSAGNNLLFGSDDFGEEIEVPADERYVSLALTASAGASVTASAGLATFGFSPGSSVTLANYRCFETQPAAPSVFTALADTIRGFCFPADLDDLRALPEKSFVTVTGTGSLAFSADANLVALVNPLASVSLPVLPAPNVQSGESITVGASFGISCDFQIRIERLPQGRVRLGYSRKRGTDLEITATASAGISAGFGSQDLFSTLIRAISANAAASQQELQNAGLSPGQAEGLQQAVRAGVQRKLELAVAAELGSAQSSGTAFLYEVDLDALDDKGREIVSAALHGNLSELAAITDAAPGITAVRNVIAALHERQHTLKINLLGIYNVVSTFQLALSGKVMFDPATGDIVITDSASANRFQASLVNFGADSQKLRRVLAESFLITAAYRGSNFLVGAPQLKSSHTFFALNNSTDGPAMRHDLNIGVALGLFPASERDGLIGSVDDFGRSTVYAEAGYDDSLTAALFLNNGQPRAIEEYETAGREAIQFLVLEGDQDEYRRQPAIDDALWAKMKAAGQFNFQPLFPNLTGSQVDVIAADYSVIVWWAETMRGTAQKLAAMRAFLAARPGVVWTDADFRGRRDDLASHLKAVANDTKEEFGRPWGLIAMDIISGQAADASIQITGPRLAVSRRRGTAAGAGG